jgi:hypothetical protein
MRALARASLAAIFIGTAVAGCFLITGGTSGYGLAPPGEGICAPSVDADLPITCACNSSTECHGDGAAQFCCLAVSSTSASASTSCQATPCDAAVGPQLCTTNAECVDASCILQWCSAAGASIPVEVCGNIAVCSP